MLRLKGKTHIMIGAAAGITIAVKYPIEKQMLFLTFTTLGSLIPDIDHPRSTLNQKILPIKNKFFKEIFYLGVGLGSIYFSYKLNIKAFTLIGIALILTGLSSHRGFTHSLLGLLIYWAGIYYITNSVYNLSMAHIGFAIGYMSHLVADMMTNKGIQLFYPLKPRVKFPLTITTGGIGEYVIMIIALVCFVNELVKYFV